MIPRRTQSPQVSLTINSPQRSMCQSTSDKSTQPGSCCISLRAVTLHPQPRYLSPVGCVSTIPFSPTAVVSRLGTWSDSAPEEIYTSYISFRNVDELQILPTQSSSNYQTLSSEIYTPKSPVKCLL